MNNEKLSNFGENMDLHEQIEAKRMKLARVLFSPQRTYPLRNAKNVLRLAGELVQIASIIREETNKQYPGSFGDA